MIEVCCVKWGTEYSEDYVHILESMVRRYSTVPFNFICYSDTPIKGITTRFLSNDLDGWWNKIWMFNALNTKADRCVYFDLDTIITGNIDWLLDYRGHIMGIENLGTVNKYENPNNYKNHFQSGVLAWNVSSCNVIWNTFAQNAQSIVEEFRGDGEWLNHCLINPDLLQHKYPNQLKSYKYQCYDDGGPGDASIVCFHGTPRPHQSISETTYPWGVEFKPSPWVRDFWRL